MVLEIVELLAIQKAIMLEEVELKERIVVILVVVIQPTGGKIHLRRLQMEQVPMNPKL